MIILGVMIHAMILSPDTTRMILSPEYNNIYIIYSII